MTIDDPESWIDRLAEQDMAAFTPGPREMLCPECNMIHRPEMGCE